MINGMHHDPHAAGTFGNMNRLQDMCANDGAKTLFVVFYPNWKSRTIHPHTYLRTCSVVIVIGINSYMMANEIDCPHCMLPESVD